MEEWLLLDLMYYTGTEYDYLPANDTHPNTVEMRIELITFCPDGTIKIR